MSKKGIIFDLDGTLWDSSQEVTDSWNIALSKFDDIKVRLTVEDLHNMMGKMMNEIAKIILPDIADSYRDEIFEECCRVEEEYVKEHGATLYPNLIETLKELKKEYELIVVSNCQDGYIQLFLEFHDLHGYFVDFESHGKTGFTKAGNITEVIKRNELTQAFYLGDTRGDFESATKAGIPFVLAEYGFGEVEEAQYKIKDLSELVPLAKEILS